MLPLLVLAGLLPVLALLLRVQLPQEPEPLVVDCLVALLPLELPRLPLLEPLRHRLGCLVRSANTSRHSMLRQRACKCPACSIRNSKMRRHRFLSRCRVARKRWPQSLLKVRRLRFRLDCKSACAVAPCFAGVCNG